MPSQLGSTLYTAKEIAERVLRMIGAYSIHDTAADPDDLYETLYWLDMMLADLAGRGRDFWLIKDELQITLVAADNSYVLGTELNASLPQGTQFPIAAWLQDTSGNRTPLRIVTQKEFRGQSLPTTTGAPEMVFIDRLNGPTLYTYPVPTTTDAGKKIILIVQRFAPNVKPQNVTNKVPLTNQRADLRPSWNLWASFNLASIVGDGPVRALPRDRIQHWEQRAQRIETELKAFENREHDNDPPIVKASAYL